MLVSVRVTVSPNPNPDPNPNPTLTITLTLTLTLTLNPNPNPDQVAWCAAFRPSVCGPRTLWLPAALLAATGVGLGVSHRAIRSVGHGGAAWVGRGLALAL